MFVSTYPMGNGEPFIESELLYTHTFWKEIFLIRNIQEQGGKDRQIPTNSSAMAVSISKKNGRKYSVLRNFSLVLYILLLELINSRQKVLYILGIKKHFSLLKASFRMADQIEALPKFNHEACFYSYWFNEWNLALSILRYKKKINKNYTRAHGFDLYENNGKPNYQPFRKFCLKNTDTVFTVSEAGAQYLKERYNRFQQKIKSSHLGTEDMGIGPTVHVSDVIQIVSCGSLVEVKRPTLIIDILKACTFKVKWIHIGDGYLRKHLETLSHTLPENIQCCFMGRLSQKEVFEFYSKNYVDCFLNTSISEGLPVSIMEAISFGIPIIATNVGGTSEIVRNNITGKLIDVNFDVFQVANMIQNVRPEFNDKRQQIRDFWSKKFNAKINYTIFSNELI